MNSEFMLRISDSDGKGFSITAVGAVPDAHKAAINLLFSKFCAQNHSATNKCIVNRGTFKVMIWIEEGFDHNLVASAYECFVEWLLLS